MTRFERDLKEAKNGNATVILKERKAELDRLTMEGKACKNKFRMQSIAQEEVRLTREYNEIDKLV